MSDLPIPKSRNEQFLSAIATKNTDNLPTPKTRNELFLDYIAKHTEDVEVNGISITTVTNVEIDNIVNKHLGGL